MKRELRSIKKSLEKAGVKNGVEFNHDEIEIFIEDEENPGRADEEATEALKDKIRDYLPAGFGGYQTGYGGWVFRMGYRGRGDFMDKSSDHHYH